MSALSELLSEGLERGWFAGAAAIQAGPDGVLLEEYAGEARLLPEAQAGPATEATLWDLGSLTKPIAGAALVLGLAREKALSLDDPVGRFFDLWKKTRFSGVTLRLLLAHQAGLAAWFPCYARGEGRKAYAKTLAEVDPAGPPGRETLYSCLGYLMLAEVVERAASATIDVLFRERVAGPLGLQRDLLFSPEGSDRARAAGGERDDATERRLCAERGLAYTGFRTGVVNGEANDGNAWRRAAGVSLNAGLFGTARAVAEFGRVRLLSDERTLLEADIASSAGSSLFVDPERRRVFVLLTNRLHPDARGGDMNAFRRRFHEVAAAL